MRLCANLFRSHLVYVTEHLVFTILIVSMLIRDIYPFSEKLINLETA